MEKIKSLLKNKKFKIAALVIFAVAAAGVILLILSGGKIKATDTVKLKDISKVQDVTLIGHRGLSSQAPENTLAAFELAAEKGMKSVEFDIQPTKDGVWVLSHDTTLKRMTDGKGKISDYTFFDLADFTIDNGANIKDYENLKIPSLDAALDCCLENGLEPMIEVKDFNQKAIKRLVDSIVSHGYESSCRVISFNHDALDAIKKINSEIKLAYLVTELNDDEMETCLAHPDMGVSFNASKKHNTPEKIKKLQKNDIELFCWVVDEKEDFDFYYKAGIKQFVTNRIIP